MTELVALVDQAARGEEGAQRELYCRFKPALARLAGGFMALDRDEVEDVVQETFIRAFQSLPQLRDVASFQAWLFSIARNRARSRMEARGLQARLRERVAVESSGTSPHFPSLSIGPGVMAGVSWTVSGSFEVAAHGNATWTALTVDAQSRWVGMASGWLAAGYRF